MQHPPKVYILREVSDQVRRRFGLDATSGQGARASYMVFRLISYLRRQSMGLNYAYRGDLTNVVHVHVDD